MDALKPKSEGKCIYCNKLFAQAGISKHLNLHLAEEAKKQKDFATADSLRAELVSMGIDVRDAASESTWEVIK